MLKGKLVRLREYRQSDVELAYKYMNDPEVMLNLGNGIPYPMTLEKEQEWFNSQAKSEDNYNFAIESLKEGLYIGGCGINWYDWKNGTAEVGIFIGDPRYRGKGYGTDAMKILIDFLFQQTNINRIQLATYSFNERAIKSYLKCGFKEEGRLRQRIFRYGQYYDEILMGLLREDYNKLFKKNMDKSNE
ncbi:MAG: GNAT family N-acetyltransferase [Tissierellia bacterium]|nr:GNAT family N-acetyltransferase [Tissierellia bacterium]